MAKAMEEIKQMILNDGNKIPAVGFGVFMIPSKPGI